MSVDIGKDLQAAYDNGYAQAIIDIKIANNPQTNADRIRAMSDEELADWILYRITDEDGAICPPPFQSPDRCSSAPCPRCWIDWLKSLAEES